MSPSELREIAVQREQWAEDAEAKDLHGSAKEWRLTAAIARELADLLDQPRGGMPFGGQSL